jgi:catechol 2,3-dioxygenase-like lactoylglutathione lyase family enzyme
MQRFVRLAVAAVPFVVSASLLCTPATRACGAEDARSEFARTTIDVGMVVGDIDRAVKFYTDALGFKPAPGFTVAGNFAADAGLTSGAKLDIRVLVLGDGESATKLKLMQIAGERAKKSDNQFIHSQLGVRYLTIFVADTTAALARLEKAGVKPIAKTPVPVPENIAKGLLLTIVRDPDGNMIELVGPKK